MHLSMKNVLNVLCEVPGNKHENIHVHGEKKTIRILVLMSKNFGVHYEAELKILAENNGLIFQKFKNSHSLKDVPLT